MNPYEAFVSELSRIMEQAQSFQLGGFPVAEPPPSARPPSTGSASAPQARALIFSPHPDDEVIIGGLPLRLLRERGWAVFNVAVTLGSNPARQAARWEELEACCQHVGFGLLTTGARGLESVNVKTRAAQPEVWAKSVGCIADILRAHQPRAIFFPHDDDWNSTHIGTHHLVVDALTQLGPRLECLALETEFWGAMKTPNLLVESSPRDLIDLITALSCHVGEVKRNPYHLRLPAWLMDNVRRGGELVGGQGGPAPDFLFGTLYRMRRWRGGSWENVLSQGRFLAQNENMAALFEKG
ncbi:MAG TPA: PIG-L family deacetylase [Verrucomicrobiae bacterium]|nr:PIG-L family deacetylase [Verrucomicrobiae bacterium]